MLAQRFRNSNPAVVAVCVAAALFAIYTVNLSFLAHGDPVPGAMTALSIVREGDIDLNEYAGSELGAALAWKDPGKLPYYAIRGRDPALVVSVFGIWHAVVASPVFAIADLFIDRWDHVALGFVAKTAASAIVAATGAVLFLFLLGLLGGARETAGLFALLFGLGTCVWPISSQGLWQHGPSELALALALLALQRRRWGWLGLVLGAAAAIRPTNLALLVLAGGWVAWSDRRAFVAFVAGAAGPVVAQAVYSAWYLGDPFAQGQLIQAARIATFKTGSPEIWRIPPWEGLPGVLLSPSRGLLVFSPFLAAAAHPLWAKIREWGSRRAIPRAGETDGVPFFLFMGGLVLVLIGASWFDWWGGWSFGYRSILDSVVFWVPLAALGWRALGEGRRTAFRVLAAWSVLVQAIGAFGSDLTQWNNRPDVDKNPRRLWDVSDSQILWHLRNPGFKASAWKILFARMAGGDAHFDLHEVAVDSFGGSVVDMIPLKEGENQDLAIRDLYEKTIRENNANAKIRAAYRDFCRNKPAVGCAYLRESQNGEAGRNEP